MGGGRRVGAREGKQETVRGLSTPRPVRGAVAWRGSGRGHGEKRAHLPPSSLELGDDVGWEEEEEEEVDVSVT